MLERRLILPAALRNNNGELVTFQDGDTIVLTARDTGMLEKYFDYLHIERGSEVLQILQRDEHGTEHPIEKIEASCEIKAIIEALKVVLSLCLPKDLCITIEQSTSTVWRMRIISFKTFGKSMEKAALT